MKKIILLLFVAILSACAATKGIYDPALKNTEPTKFSFNGPAVAFEAFMKRLLVSNAFSIADFDKEAGIIATDFKELIDDEKFNTTGAALLGVSVNSQKGKLVFLYESISDSLVSFNMAGYLSVDATYSQSLYQQNQVGYGGTLLQQGHPLCMKYRNKLMMDPLVTLE